MAKKREIVTEGVAHIKATFNNTLVTITTLSGDALCSCSSGECGFKGARKGTPFAAQQAAEKAAAKAKEMLQRTNGARTIPQIFIGETYIGGNDKLQEANRKGELDKLLSE